MNKEQNHKNLQKKYNNFLIYFTSTLIIIFLLIIAYRPILSEENKNENIDEIIVDEKIKWTSIGDSITDYCTFGISSKVYGDYIEEETNYDFINLGYGGSGFLAGINDEKNYLNRIKLMPRDTRVVTIFGSLNDCFLVNYPIGDINDDGLYTLYGQMNNLLKEIYKVNKYMSIGIITPTQWGISNYQKKTAYSFLVSDYIKALKEFASYNSLPILDLYSQSGLRVWEDEISEHFKEEQNIHPDALLHKIFLSPKIKNFLFYLGEGNSNNIDININLENDFVESEDNNFLNIDNVRSLKIGNMVYFGKNEWIIIEKDKDKIKLLSKNIIKTKPFNNTRDLITWKESNLRQYLNTEFYEEYFDEEEKKRIIEMELSHHNSVAYATESDIAKEYIINVKDKVTLLSYNEIYNNPIYKLFLKSKGTKKAYSEGLYIDNVAYGYYWLRDTGSFFHNAMFVDDNGEINKSGYYVDTQTIGVRPIIYIKY
ncbi:MAG: DUF6273 domain-containing protein [Eubacteriales bacterium]|nr:DUF6273 domain-containing protein [Eubacteriales bacterium]